jgi:radical SAM superfamily enzyme YgiQ (UPF0313 family)
MRTKDDYIQSVVSDLNNLPFPAWDMFDLTKYPGTYPHRTKLELPMIIERGCPYKCTFCCRVLGDVPRRRSVNSVMGEIEHNILKYQCESIVFLDETFMGNPKWTEEFLVKHDFPIIRLTTPKRPDFFLGHLCRPVNT